ncbi:GNAT family N-acetyltransferase [Actinocrispum wychmicini]|uniref:GNAT family N-acetyltransferase n=1 Tax=Actinocrispum wychmicini TaxID=1213861 RepID=UPI0014047F0D|nr:GNAT family N-acetyltransferase [Actinocrispum wychmicini]
MNNVTLAGPDQWSAYREIRIAALTDSPEAFGSTLDRELGLAEAEWRRRLADSHTFFGHRDGKLQAIATGITLPDGDGELVGVWTHPSARGTGLSAEVVGAVVTWAQDHDLTLWAMVASTNPAAERFYAKLGFRRSGITTPNPHHPDSDDHRLVLDRR